MTAASGDIVGPRGGVVLVSSTAYTWRAEANGLTLVFISGSAVTFTVPVGLPIGMTSKVIQLGAGVITFAAGSGVALNSATGMFTPSAQYAEVTLGSVGVDSYILSGEVSGGGGGGAAIQPQTGSSPIKISAFPTSSTIGMSTTALLTGLTAAGANANYTQSQILTGAGATGYGTPIYLTGGTGTSGGGVAQVAGGAGGFVGGVARINGGAGTTTGGGVFIQAGSVNANGAGATFNGGGIANGGSLFVLAGNASSSNGSGGTLQLIGGNGYGSGNAAGSIYLSLGTVYNSATPGILSLINMISTPSSHLGTLTNAPAAGNPQFWLAVTINGTPYFIPAWHA
jgi:hypothetical protein